MIRSFRDREAERLFADEPVPRHARLERIIRRKLLLLHRAGSLADLRVPPGNRLEALKGDVPGSIASGSTTSGGCASAGRAAMPSR